MNRRNFITALSTSMLANACANNVSVKTLSSVVSGSFGNNSAFDPEYPDKLPYASIAVTRKGTQRALLILGKIEGDDMHWLSADRGVIVTRHGRVVKTVGFPENLLKTDFPDQDFLNNPATPDTTQKTAYRRIIDLSPGNHYGVKVESWLEQAGKETIQIGSRSYETTLIRENCAAPLLGWQYTNHYWLDNKGSVWRSQQNYAPGAASLIIEVTKPYRA